MIGKVRIYEVPNPCGEPSKKFDVTCWHCNTPLKAMRSLAMLEGVNSAVTTCPACKVFLHLRLAPYTNGSEMTSESTANHEPHADPDSAMQAAASSEYGTEAEEAHHG